MRLVYFRNPVMDGSQRMESQNGTDMVGKSRSLFYFCWEVENVNTEQAPNWVTVFNTGFEMGFLI